MQLFHLGNTAYARQLSGEGARLFGGRWNQKGDACIYTSATRSLCLLEYLAHLQPDQLPPDLSITIYQLPDNACYRIPATDLPANWDEIPIPSTTKLFGSDLLKAGQYVCFAVPSVIVPQENNFILNPGSEDFSQIKIVRVESFHFDRRIKP